MDPTAPEWFVTEYEQGVIHNFQDKGGKLFNRSMARRKTISNAKEAEFHISGILEAYLAPNGRLTPQNADKSNIKIAHDLYKCTPTIKKRDLDQMAEDDRDEAKKSGGMAMGRTADDVVIAALDANSTTPLGGTGTFMSPVFSEELNETLAVNEVDDDLEVFCAIPPRAWSQLKRFKEFANADYVGPDLPFRGSVRKWLRTYNGIHFIKHNRLTQTGDLVRCHAWVREALGVVDMGDISTIMTWENQDDYWFVNMSLTLGAGLLLEEGALPFDIDVSISPLDIDPETYTAS